MTRVLALLIAAMLAFAPVAGMACGAVCEQRQARSEADAPCGHGRSDESAATLTGHDCGLDASAVPAFENTSTRLAAAPAPRAHAAMALVTAAAPRVALHGPAPPPLRSPSVLRI